MISGIAAFLDDRKSSGRGADLHCQEANSDPGRPHANVPGAQRKHADYMATPSRVLAFLWLCVAPALAECGECLIAG